VFQTFSAVSVFLHKCMMDSAGRAHRERLVLYALLHRWGTKCKCNCNCLSGVIPHHTMSFVFLLSSPRVKQWSAAHEGSICISPSQTYRNTRVNQNPDLQTCVYYPYSISTEWQKDGKAERQRNRETEKDK
jgi:hypothetical protein